ncbi:MAG: hypothetical protein QF596_05945 [Acidimicrobiales bacterium]|jgi:hypothetical protein|nr:hypothetical protein [Acidimicrobiales bacterium]MDP6299183.1 hypothetical protein [Acidimicrobiales bacterium]HJM29400.1 hypothetical protein [Acidimicrobiales bacterium]HJM96581.1 hypothetical protein [Acidimicrobiales bacterium]
MWIYITVASVVVVTAAWFAVVSVSTRLRYTPEQVVFDIDKATDYVADNLPEAIAGRLSYQDVELLIKWELTYLRQRGIASYGSVDSIAEEASQSIDTVFAHEDELVDELYAQAVGKGLEIDAVDIVSVTELVNQYLVMLGAIGGLIDTSKFGELETE